MSHTELVPFVNGLPTSGPEFSNSWGGASRIWESLFNKYIPKRHEHDSWLLRQDNSLWDLIRDERLPIFERAVHGFTFNLFYVARNNLARFASDLREFVKNNPVGEHYVDHLSAWADWIDANQGIDAVGLYGTSVGENLWFRYKAPENEDDDNIREAVPLAEGTEVYEYVESWKKS